MLKKCRKTGKIRQKYRKIVENIEKLKNTPQQYRKTIKNFKNI